MKYQHRVMGMLSLLAVITYVDRVCIAVAGPRMQDELGISPEAWGWVASVFFISYGSFEIPTGLLGDRIGPRKVLTRIVLWWSAFTTLTGTIASYPWLLAVRFGFGVGEAGAYPNASIVIGRWIPASHRARAWGVVWMTSQVGAAISPLLVVPIQARYGWRAAFFVFGAAGVIWAGAWYWWFRDWPHQKPGVSQAELREIGPGAADVHAKMPWGRALADGTFWRIALIGASYVYAIAFFQFWLQTYLVRGRGYTEAALVLSSLPYVVGAIANASGGLLSDALVRRWGLRAGRRTVGVFGLTSAAIFMAVTSVTPSNGWALAFLSLAYAGILLQQPNLCAVCLDTGRQHAGVMFGFMNTAAQVASVLSSVGYGYIVGYTGSYNAPFIPMVLTLSIGAMLWLKLDPTHQVFEDAVQEAAA
ncbi:MAG TPA: MFS transporter [Vicinamibacterales bacterium]|jgi:MFS family permease|nr:MFS transporter [Vicinamibacterales bacterium]